MKKCFTITIAFILMLSGCFKLSLNGSETLHIDDKTYKSGFYGVLFPNDYELDGKTLKFNNIILSKIKHDEFELYHADIGPYTEGTIYCEEGDYENAVAFYNDPQNYSYYCVLGVDSNTTKTKTIEISEIDTNKFDALLKFADESNYNPFDKEHNAKIEKVDLPMPDDTQETRLVFYKESVDSLFTSSQGTDYYIINNHLYSVYQYDFGHGEYEKLIAVKVPDEISIYFVEFMKPYI